MSDVEKKILKIYDGSRPVVEDLFETSNVNQLAWTLVVILAGLLFWFTVALSNAENQRHALRTNACADRIFKGEVDKSCLVHVHSREHWYQHVWYALTHVRPSESDL